LTFKRIIVGIDSSQSAWTASEYAFQLGKRLDVPVIGVYIVDERIIDESFLEDLAGILGFTYYVGISQKVREFLENQADALLDEFLALGRSKGVKVSSFQATGVPYKLIAEQADEEDLIVIGKKGKKPVEGLLLGSTAERVLRISKCSVLIVPQEYRELKKVCVAYDGMEISKKALSIAKDLSRLFRWNVIALYVGDKDLSRDVGDGVDYVNLKGIPEEKIVQYCKEEDVDMLFMGAFSKGKLRELILGSVTLFAMHHLDIPLFMVKGNG